MTGVDDLLEVTSFLSASDEVPLGRPVRTVDVSV